MGKIAAIIAFALLVVACHHAEPVCIEHPEAPPLASCEGDEAPEGYEWRVSCDSGGGEWGNRYLWCGHRSDEFPERGYDEAATCGVDGAHCLTGEQPRCVLVPCDGEAHLGREL